MPDGKRLEKQELHDWIRDNLHLDIPMKSVCPHHDAPFEYVWHAYNEQPEDAVVWAPRGGGKTTLGAVVTLLDLLDKPTCQTRILGGSLEQSLRMWESLVPMLEDVAPGQMADERGRARRVRMKNGALAAVLTQSQRSVRGQRVQKLRCDEVDMFDREVWSAAQLVTRSRTAAELDGVEGAEDWKQGYRARIDALSTMHKPYGLMQEIIDNAASRGAKVFRWCLLDVLERCQGRDCSTCALHDECQGKARGEVANGFLRIDDAIAMKKRVCKETWETEMLCLRPSRKGMVFPAFSAQKHVCDQSWWRDDRNVSRILGIDFGFAHAFVCLWIQYDESGRVFVVDELVTKERTLEQIIGMIRAQRGGFDRIACDPAGDHANLQTAESDIAVLRNAGFAVRRKTTRILDGLEMIRTGLDPAHGVPTLRIHPRCKTLIRSMESYHYKEETTNETPHKDGINDHAVDALRYFYVNRETQRGCAGTY